MFKIVIITSSLFIFFVCFGVSVQAADLFFYSESNTIKTGKFFELDVLFNSPDDMINALEGELYFPQNLLSVIDIRENNSIINFWLEKPVVSANKIKFSGKKLDKKEKKRRSDILNRAWKKSKKPRIK